MSDEKYENLHKQKYVIKFCTKLEKTVTKIKEILDAAYKESAMSQALVYLWYKKVVFTGDFIR